MHGNIYRVFFRCFFPEGPKSWDCGFPACGKPFFQIHCPPIYGSHPPGAADIPSYTAPSFHRRDSYSTAPEDFPFLPFHTVSGSGGSSALPWLHPYHTGDPIPRRGSPPGPGIPDSIPHSYPSVLSQPSPTAYKICRCAPQRRHSEPDRHGQTSLPLKAPHDDA